MRSSQDFFLQGNGTIVVDSLDIGWFTEHYQPNMIQW